LRFGSNWLINFLKLLFIAKSPLIESSQNPLVKYVRRLHQASERRALGLFLVEGTHSVTEALAARWPLESVFYTKRWIERGEIGRDKFDAKVRCEQVSDSILKSMATTEQPDGVVAVAMFKPSEEGFRKFLKPRSLAVAVDALQDPGNLGSLIRSAAAAGGDGIYLGAGSIDPSNPKVLRASAGLWFRSPPRPVDLPTWLAKCKTDGMQVLLAKAGGKTYWDYDLKRPTVFLLGNEGGGVSPEIESLADATISIPMQPIVESLNVAMTGTLLMYEAARQRLQSKA
jgi:TrmH family RNA methyltransferase